MAINKSTWSRPLTLAQLIISLAVTIIGGAVTAGYTWATVMSDIHELQEKVSRIDRSDEEKLTQERRLARMERNIVRIADKVGAKVEDPE